MPIHPAQEANPQLLDQLNQEIASLLLNKDIGAVANELANAEAGTVAELLRNLIAFARAGQDGTQANTGTIG